jgi:hypothetical protein
LRPRTRRAVPSTAPATLLNSKLSMDETWPHKDFILPETNGFGSGFQ